MRAIGQATPIGQSARHGLRCYTRGKMLYWIEIAERFTAGLSILATAGLLAASVHAFIQRRGAGLRAKRKQQEQYQRFLAFLAMVRDASSQSPSTRR